MAQAMLSQCTGGEEGASQAPALPSIPSIPSLLSHFLPLFLLFLVLLRMHLRCASSFPPPLLTSSLRSLSLAPRCARHASCRFVRVCGAQQLSLFPPPSVFISPCFFVPLHLTLCASLEQRARSRVARCNTLRFSFFCKRKKRSCKRTKRVRTKRVRTKRVRVVLFSARQRGDAGRVLLAA